MSKSVAQCFRFPAVGVGWRGLSGRRGIPPSQPTSPGRPIRIPGSGHRAWPRRWPVNCARSSAKFTPRGQACRWPVHPARPFGGDSEMPGLASLVPLRPRQRPARNPDAFTVARRVSEGRVTEDGRLQIGHNGEGRKTLSLAYRRVDFSGERCTITALPPGPRRDVCARGAGMFGRSNCRQTRSGNGDDIGQPWSGAAPEQRHQALQVERDRRPTPFCAHPAQAAKQESPQAELMLDHGEGTLPGMTTQCIGRLRFGRRRCNAKPSSRYSR